MDADAAIRHADFRRGAPAATLPLRYYAADIYDLRHATPCHSADAGLRRR